MDTTYLDRISVHEQFEVYVQEYFRKSGYQIVNTTIYEKLTDERPIAKTISSIHNPTAFKARFVADYLVLKDEQSFYLDVKCGKYSDRSFIEAIPLLLHIYESYIGVKTLYALWSTTQSKSYGFWGDENLEIERLIIPNRSEYRTEEMQTYIDTLIKRTVGYLPIDFTTNSNGSGTPYCIIRHPQKTWKKLIKEELGM